MCLCWRECCLTGMVFGGDVVVYECLCLYCFLNGFWSECSFTCLVGMVLVGMCLAGMCLVGRGLAAMFGGNVVVRTGVVWMAVALIVFGISFCSWNGF